MFNRVFSKQVSSMTSHMVADTSLYIVQTGNNSINKYFEKMNNFISVHRNTINLDSTENYGCRYLDRDSTAYTHLRTPYSTSLFSVFRHSLPPGWVWRRPFERGSFIANLSFGSIKVITSTSEMKGDTSALKPSITGSGRDQDGSVAKGNQYPWGRQDPEFRLVGIRNRVHTEPIRSERTWHDACSMSKGETFPIHQEARPAVRLLRGRDVTNMERPALLCGGTTFSNSNLLPSPLCAQ